MYFWENDKVRLRMIDENDSDILEKCLRDTASRKQPDHGIALPATYQVAEDMVQYAIDSTKEGEELWFAVLDSEETMVGYAVTDWFDIENGNVQLSINIFDEYKRNGYATAASNILLKYLFNERRFHKVGCCVLEDNYAGNAFVKCIGFNTDAFRDEMFYTHGTYLGEYYYSILKEEFDAGITKRDNYEWQKSSLGKLADSVVKDGKLVKPPSNPGDDREYFWEYDGIVLRDMTPEDYMVNRNIIYDTQACVYFDGEVKLPYMDGELTEFEKAHLNFGCDDDRIEFAICNSHEQYVGNINICGLDRKNGKFSYSVYISEEHRGHGYATKALRLILWYCFEELRMNKMICNVNEGNTGSAMVMRKVGCRTEGIMRENEYYHGRYVDAVMFGVTREEFMTFNRFDE